MRVYTLQARARFITLYYRYVDSLYRPATHRRRESGPYSEIVKILTIFVCFFFPCSFVLTSKSHEKRTTAVAGTHNRLSHFYFVFRFYFLSSNDSPPHDHTIFITTIFEFKRYGHSRGKKTPPYRRRFLIIFVCNSIAAVTLRQCGRLFTPSL